MDRSREEILQEFDYPNNVVQTAPPMASTTQQVRDRIKLEADLDRRDSMKGMRLGVLVTIRTINTVRVGANTTHYIFYTEDDGVLAVDSELSNFTLTGGL